MKNEDNKPTKLEQASEASDDNLEEGISVMDKELRKQISGGIIDLDLESDDEGNQMRSQMIP
jgi:hypothetical protein